jgi:hypothetical protein
MQVVRQAVTIKARGRKTVTVEGWSAHRDKGAVPGSRDASWMGRKAVICA